MNILHFSDNLEAEAKQFKVSSRKIKQKYCCQNARTCLCLIIVIVVILLVIAGVIVLGKSRSHKNYNMNTVVTFCVMRLII